MAEPPLIYAFEELTAELARPPMAALRALLSVGVIVSPQGWQALSVETRTRIAQEGARDLVNLDAVKELAKQIPVNCIKLLSRTADPSGDDVPSALASALGPIRPLSRADWRKLRAIDRHVLASLAHNTRLLWRALDEILKTTSAKAWSGAVARSELRLRPEALKQLLAADFMGGRAFVLARVAGRRAARRSPEIFDLAADSTVGPVEIDWGVRHDEGVIFWQAHVSSWEGGFFPEAALLAATTAAIALHGMTFKLDPDVAVTKGHIREEPWQAGRDETAEPATAFYSKEISAPRPNTPKLASTVRVSEAPPGLESRSPKRSDASDWAPGTSMPPPLVAPAAAPSEPNRLAALAKDPQQSERSPVVFGLILALLVVAAVGAGVGLAILYHHGFRHH